MDKTNVRKLLTTSGLYRIGYIANLVFTTYALVKFRHRITSHSFGFRAVSALRSDPIWQAFIQSDFNLDTPIRRRKGTANRRYLPHKGRHCRVESSSPFSHLRPNGDVFPGPWGSGAFSRLARDVQNTPLPHSTPLCHQKSQNLTTKREKAAKTILISL